MNLVMSPKKLEILRNSNLHISMLMCYSLANHEPSTMYLSNYLLQGITWGHRSRGSIGDFLKTTILVLALLKGKVEGICQIKRRKFYLSYHLIYLPCPLALSSCVISNPSLDMVFCACDSYCYFYLLVLSQLSCLLLLLTLSDRVASEFVWRLSVHPKPQLSTSRGNQKPLVSTSHAFELKLKSIPACLRLTLHFIPISVIFHFWYYVSSLNLHLTNP